MLWAIGITGVLYLIYAVVMVTLHPRFVYPFDDQVFSAPGFAAHDVAVPGRPPLTLYVGDAPMGAPVVLYFMGNIGALGYFAPMLQHHARAGRQVVAMGYRGGGGLPGAPSETQLKADALVAFDALPQVVGPRHGPVVVQGYSLGTGLALHVAARRDVAGVILAAPYTRLCRLMTRASGLPACILPGIQRWRSDLDAPKVRAPSLLLHGDRDGLVPFAHGVEMGELLRRGEGVARFVAVTGAGHVDLFDTPPYLGEIDRFLSGFQ